MSCEFGAILGEALRDRLVCGLGNKAHQKRLLSEPELTLDKVLVIAQSLETADTNAKTLYGNEPALHWLSHCSLHQHFAPFLKEGRPSSQHHGRECYCCGSGDYIAANCCFAEFICHNSKKGHLAHVCRLTKSQDALVMEDTWPRGCQGPSLIHGQSEWFHYFILCAGCTTLIQVDISLDLAPITMEVDMGAAVSVMSSRQQGELFPG